MVFYEKYLQTKKSMVSGKKFEFKHQQYKAPVSPLIMCEDELRTVIFWLLCQCC